MHAGEPPAGSGEDPTPAAESAGPPPPPPRPSLTPVGPPAPAEPGAPEGGPPVPGRWPPPPAGWPPPSPGWPAPPAGWPPPPPSGPPPPPAWPPPAPGWPPPPGGWPPPAPPPGWARHPPAAWPPSPPSGWPPPQAGYPPYPPYAAYPAYGGAWHDRRQPYPGWTAGGPLPPGTGRFRPLGIPEIIDAGFTIFRRNFLLIVAIAAVIAIPEALLNLAVSHGLDVGGHYDDLQNIQQRAAARGDRITQAETNSFANDVTVILVYSALLLVVQFLILQPLGKAATTRAVSDRYLDRPASFTTSFGAGLRALGPLVAASLIQVVLFAVPVGLIVLFAILAGQNAGVVAVVLALPLLPLAIFVYVRWSLAPQTIVVERVGPIRGLGRSWELTRRSFWRTLWLYLLLSLITGIVSGVLSTIAGAPITSFGTSTSQLAVQAVVTAVVGILVAPLTLIASTIYYYDLRIRKEAFDLEMLAESL